MDFDELDDVIEAKLAAGEELEGAAAALLAPPPRPGRYDPGSHPARPRQPYEPRSYMPPVPRNRRWPGIEHLQDFVSNRLQKEMKREVCIRVFAFPGAGDTAGAWGEIMRFAPPFMEVAVHEWPSHGTRSEEPPCDTLQDLASDAFKGLKTAAAQHAVGGPLEGAPFALLGHSIGGLLLVHVAALLRAELGLEPALVIVLDRVAPHIDMFTEAGRELLRTDGNEFMRHYNSEICRCADAAGGERGRKMVQMWLNDVKFANEVMPFGFHVFECDLLILKGLHMSHIDQDVLGAHPDPVKVAAHRARDVLMGSSPGSAMDYDFEHFDEWCRWTTGACVVEGIATDHMGIKSHEGALELVHRNVRRFMASAPV